MRALCATGVSREFRTQATLSLREMGSAAGVSAATVHRWESGKAKPTGPRALAYARALRSIEPLT